jgi:hypothetical protein
VSVIDPQARRGARRRLVVVLAAAVCAVAAGAQSDVAIAEWFADLPDEVAAALGLGQQYPCESTIRRIVQRLGFFPVPKPQGGLLVRPLQRRSPPT